MTTVPSENTAGDPQAPPILTPCRRHQLRIVAPVDRDVSIIILTRYLWNEDEEGNQFDGHSYVMADEGWTEFAPYETIPEDKMTRLTISGSELISGDKMRQLWQARFIDHLCLFVSKVELSDLVQEHLFKNPALRHTGAEVTFGTDNWP